MRVNRKAVTVSIFIFILSLCLMAGCQTKSGNKGTSSSQQSTQVTPAISAAELSTIAAGNEVSIADSSYGTYIWAPKVQKDTLSEITSWLKKADLYKTKIPKSKSTTFAADIFPTTLSITASSNQIITIQPASYVISQAGSFHVRYVPNVLQLKYGDKTTYIQSVDLYNWLLSDEWKSEFS